MGCIGLSMVVPCAKRTRPLVVMTNLVHSAQGLNGNDLPFAEARALNRYERPYAGCTGPQWA